jgi:hypothetical protein
MASGRLLLQGCHAAAQIVDVVEVGLDGLANATSLAGGG